MAGKSNKARGKGHSSRSSVAADSNGLGSKVSVATPAVEDGVDSSEHREILETSGAGDSGSNSSSTINGVSDVKMDTDATSTAKQVDGEIHLYAISVKTLSGEMLELQLSSGDSAMDIRQFLLDARETCYFTCYDLLLHTKDGSTHHLGDYNEVSEVGDITTGGCSIEMVGALYDDRSIRSQVRRSRELILQYNLPTSLSTSLALQHETTKQKMTDSSKVDSTQLDGLGFLGDSSPSLSDFMTSSTKEIACVECIVFSSFNPPPSYRRLVGDLIYIDVVTLEGNKFCITGTTKGFYVNSSSGAILDPRQLKPAYEASTLISLLQKLSPMFKKGFHEILDWKASAHPFENVSSPLPTNLWLGIHPSPDHKRDAARAEDAMIVSFGAEQIGMQRDWNEELQSCKEFPNKNIQERTLRDRALYKVTCDFVEAAVSGAIGVISRCIPPLNPTDPECFHMYAHNNIFFSFAVDAEIEQLSKFHQLASSSNFVQTDQCIRPKNFIPSQDKSTLVISQSSDNSSDCSDSNNAAESEGLPDASVEGQISESEQATYASVNNDLKGTKAYQEADVPGLHNLAMAIIDYRGHRVVAQSIIPGILQGHKTESLLYGSVDNGKKICWNDSFHSKVLEAAKHLHLKEHSVLDGSGNAVKLAVAVECKGIAGSDDRHYLLDLMRATPRDANYIGPGFRFFVLRPELVSSFCQAEVAERLRSKSDLGVEIPVVSKSQVSEGLDISTELSAKDSEEGCAVDSSLSEEVLLNPNVFTEFKLVGSEEEIAADEAVVRKASSYLIDVVIPKFAQDLCSLEVSPMDGRTLTDALHAHGINVRYVGKVSDRIKHLPHLWDIFVNEIVVRSAKHILKEVLRESQDHDLAAAISHFFNCLFGEVPSSSLSNSHWAAQKKLDHESHQPQSKSMKVQTKSPKVQIKQLHGTFPGQKSPTYAHLSSEELWHYVQEFSRFKYQFDSWDGVRLRVKKLLVVRNLCQKVGITIVAREYDLGCSAPFHAADIVNLQPVVKHSVPVCLEARNLMDVGKARLAEGTLNEAYALFSEAFTVLQQVTGPMHREVANCCRYLAMVLYHAGDMAGAILQQHKELIINERCLGLDHPDTAHSYGNMALFYHGLNQTELALQHVSRALLLLSLSSGPDHPDIAASCINVAMMYQDIGNMNAALRYLQEALKKNKELLGEEHIQTAVCYHALAIAFNCMGAYKLSLQHEKTTYDILVKQLGKEDARTCESEHWIMKFKLREEQVNAQKQKGQILDAASAQQTLDMLKAFQARGMGSGNKRPSSSSINKTINAALIGEAMPRGRGVDERAARAAAEIRKKAAARGLPLRSNAPPANALPLAQFMRMIGSGANSPSASQGIPQANNPTTEREASGTPITSNGNSVPSEKTPEAAAAVDAAAPVGLGTGLSSLESKKNKTKPKNATSRS